MQTKAVTTTAPTAVSAYVVLAVGIAAVSLAAVLIKLAQREMVPSVLIAASRLVIATLILTPLTLRSSTYRQQIAGLRRQDVRLIMLAGLFLALHFATWVTSLEYTTVLVSVILVTTSPIWVAVLEVIFLRAQLTRTVILGLCTALAGGVVIGVSGGLGGQGSAADTLFGAFLSLVGAVTVAIYLIIGRRLRPVIALAPYVWMVYGCAALLLAAAVLISGTPVLGYSANRYLLMLGVALFPQLIGHTSFNYALAVLPATVVSIASQAEPIGSAIIAYIIFREQPVTGQIIGSLIILLGVLLATFRPPALPTNALPSA